MIKNYYENIILYDFLLKNKVKNIFQLVKIKKICINISFKNNILKKEILINIILFLKLISNQKSKVIKAKKNNIFLIIKKNSIIGCTLILRKKNIYSFLEKIIFFISPKKIRKLKNKTIINFKINNYFDFLEIKKEFIKFQKIPKINISIHTNNNFLYLLLNYLYIF